MEIDINGNFGEGGIILFWLVFVILKYGRIIWEKKILIDEFFLLVLFRRIVDDYFRRVYLIVVDVFIGFVVWYL